MELTIEQALQQGVAAHREGKLQDAERLYRAILQSQPLHPDANHNLGILAVSVNKADAALPLFKTALEANPKVEQFWLSYIDALIKKQQFDDAKKVLEQAKKLGVAVEKINVLEAQLASINKQETVGSLSPSQEQLSNVLEHLQNGRFDDAEKLAISITQEFPKDQFGWKVLGAVLKQTGRVIESLTAMQKSVQLAPDYAEAHYNLGNTLKELGRLDEAEGSYTQAIALKPDYAEAHINLGITLQELGRLDEAEASYKQAIAWKPDYAEAHSNLGITLQELGRLDEAEASLRQAIALKPDYAEAHSNLGITLQELGRLEEAEASYIQAITVKTDLAEAHNNLGNTLQELGRLDEAEASYNQAIALKPDYAEAHRNLVELLTSYISKNESSQPIVKVDQEIKKINLKEEIPGVISNDKIIHLFYKSSNIIKKHDLDLGTELSQVYRRNSVDLNCKRHMQIFNKFNVIPKFCFGCYKVQVEPRSVLELIKLFVVFDQIKLSENNIRKCMIEMRSEIFGFYKGLIYCSSIEEAYQIADYLEMVIKEKIGSGLPLVVKRGCSEYSVVFPDYKEINKSGAQLMNYNEDWKLVEEDYDSKNSIKNKRLINLSLSCLSLSDVLIIRNWIDYAKGIGDSSAQLLNQNGVVSQRVYEIAKSRLETHVWRELI
jgi:tetratricopeptide (TPR) repeat protein